MRLIDADAFKEWLINHSINEREEEESKQIGIWIDAFSSASPDLSTYSDRLWKNAYERGKAEGRKKGKWIDSRDVSWMCSECGKWLDVLQGDVDMNFCPNCGSYNGGEEE